jgi:hypothetical protein
VTAVFAMVTAAALAVVLAGFLYFRRFELARPPVGTFNLRDVAVMFAGIVAVPYLYLALPLPLVAVIFTAVIAGVLQLVLEPVLRSRSLVWIAVLALVASDIVAALAYGQGSRPFLAVNDVVLALAVVGVANLLAQSGMRASSVAVLAGALTVYDVVATSHLTLMTDLLERLGRIPFMPVLGWNDGTHGLGVGLGDLLLATLFPLVARKAFGRRAGTVAAALSVGAIALMLGLVALGVVPAVVPVMVALGPVTVLQYCAWRRRRNRERTTWEYLRAEPRRGHEPQALGPAGDPIFERPIDRSPSAASAGPGLIPAALTPTLEGGDLRG